MRITVDISMYPLAEDYKPAIKNFVHKLRTFARLQIVTNQLSTQVNGEFTDVNAALTECMRDVMQAPQKVVFVARYVNADLDVSTLPELD